MPVISHSLLVYDSSFSSVRVFYFAPVNFQSRFRTNRWWAAYVLSSGWMMIILLIFVLVTFAWTAKVYRRYCTVTRSSENYSFLPWRLFLFSISVPLSTYRGKLVLRAAVRTSFTLTMYRANHETRSGFLQWIFKTIVIRFLKKLSDIIILKFLLKSILYQMNKSSTNPLATEISTYSDHVSQQCNRQIRIKMSASKRCPIAF